VGRSLGAHDLIGAARNGAMGGTSEHLTWLIR